MEQHLYHDMNRLEHSHWWFLARREIITSVIEAYVPHRAPVLDVGCGTGFVLERLQGDYEAHGIDTAEVAVDFCRAKGLTRIHLGELGRSDLGRGQFDMVTFLDVIEHVDDDVEMLRRARSVIKDEGLLLVTVPAHKILWSQHDVVHHHRRRYSRAELEASVRSAGYTPIHTTHFNTVLFPLIFAARMAGRLLGKNDASDAQRPPPVVNEVLFQAFRTEKRLLRKVSFPFGVSLMCVAKKNADAPAA
jgi:SAM-dependent methyltransferase